MIVYKVVRRGNDALLYSAYSAGIRRVCYWPGATMRVPNMFVFSSLYTAQSFALGRTDLEVWAAETPEAEPAPFYVLQTYAIDRLYEPFWEDTELHTIGFGDVKPAPPDSYTCNILKLKERLA